MVKLLEDHREEIAALCRRCHVARLEVFGSVLREDFVPGDSDIDLLVEFDIEDPVDRLHTYIDLCEALTGVLGVEVDLVCQGAVKNRIVRAHIERSKEAFYAA